jgi:regulator of sigma E protease
VLTLVATIVVLSVLILVHEFGHFFAAKSVDIEVPRFSLGLGPKLFGFRIGETEYVLSLLPLGGYVKMAGMEGDAEALEGGAIEEVREPGPRDFDVKPLWARAWVISAGVIMNFLFAFLVFTVLGLAYGESVDPTTRVAVRTSEAVGSYAPLQTLPLGAELTRVGGHAVASWDEVQAAVLGAPVGPLTLEFANHAPLVLEMARGDSVRLALLRAMQPLHAPIIGEVVPGTPAAAAGLRTGDRVLTAAGEPIESWTAFEDAIRVRPGAPLPLEVARGGEHVALIATPSEAKELNPEMRQVAVGKLGVAPKVEIEHRRLGVGEAIAHGAEATWSTSVSIVRFLGDLITGAASARNLGGPIAIGQLSGQAARFGLESFLGFMALLSINLAVLNLLPIPILDGGHLLFLAVEAVRGRPLSVEQRIRLSHLGLIVVVGIMVWAIANDVLRVFGV